MKSEGEEYLDLPYAIVVVPDVTTDGEPCYMAYHPQLGGCMSHGATPEEALHNLAEARELYISTLLEKGLQVPLPGGTGITWDVVGPTSEVAEDTGPSLPATPPVFAPAG